jgi:hypothetical protein
VNCGVVEDAGVICGAGAGAGAGVGVVHPKACQKLGGCTGPGCCWVTSTADDMGGATPTILALLASICTRRGGVIDSVYVLPFPRKHKQSMRALDPETYQQPQRAW